MKGDGEWRGRVRVDIEKLVLWGFFFLRDLSSPTRNRIWALSSDSTESKPLDHQGIPCCVVLLCPFVLLWNIYIDCWHFINFTPYFLVEGKDVGSGWSWQAVTITCVWKQDLLEHGHSHLFTYRVRLLSNGRVELWQRPCARRVSNIYYLAYIEKICQLML